MKIFISLVPSEIMILVADVRKTRKGPTDLSTSLFIRPLLDVVVMFGVSGSIIFWSPAGERSANTISPGLYSVLIITDLSNKCLQLAWRKRCRQEILEVGPGFVFFCFV